MTRKVKLKSATKPSAHSRRYAVAAEKPIGAVDVDSAAAVRAFTSAGKLRARIVNVTPVGDGKSVSIDFEMSLPDPSESVDPDPAFDRMRPVKSP